MFFSSFLLSLWAGDDLSDGKPLGRVSRFGSPQPFSPLSSSLLSSPFLSSSLLSPFLFFSFSCALYRGAQERLLQFPAVAAAAVARPGHWCATPCGAVLSGTVSRGRPFCHFGGWGWGARASENSSGYGCQDASWTEADPKRRKASPPPLLGQSCFDCLNNGKGASEGRGRSPTATMVGHIRSSRHDIFLRDVCRADVLIPFLTPACWRPFCPILAGDRYALLRTLIFRVRSTSARRVRFS